ncbi:hypothetical protein CALVIDRAFT_256838 [Calocera viscosa TUFC12733]|uniref:Arrestin-like N-terminal domain-containing protein n=1 Tax=Calocera viscosa (strain TUFC12733) TaxID=1330018 RepID=A0A167J9E8_CALVF|nr:hypothetical protein CALVIDRAFT_256838 [Calocera viscosa TUFC12733]
MAAYPYAWSTPQLRHPNDVKHDAPIILEKAAPQRLAILDEDVRRRGDDRVDHEFVLRARRRPILSLRCKSRASASSHKPVWFDGDVIEGGVQLMLHKATHVEEIIFRVRGRIAPPETGRTDIFWSTAETLWTAPSNYRSPRSPVSKLFKSQALPAGNHHWPIALQLPLQVRVDTAGGARALPLPPSFRKQNPSAVLEYEIMITVYRGMLREAYTLIIPFVFLPRSSPQYPLGRPHPSMGTLIIGPVNETTSFDSSQTLTSLTSAFSAASSSPITPLTPNLPEYYVSLETQHRSVEGTVFSIRPVTVDIRVLFRAPLIYPRGNPIVCTIVLQSSDPMALDLLAAPDSIHIQLEQKVTVAGDQVWNDVLERGSVQFRRQETLSSPISPPGGIRTKTLEGIVHVPRDTKPTFSFITFVVEHVLSLQFTPACFTPTNGKEIPKINQSIQIVTNRVLPT